MGYVDFVKDRLRTGNKEIVALFICICLIIGLIVASYYRIFFITQHIICLLFLFLSVFLPDLWFIFGDKYLKDEIITDEEKIKKVKSIHLIIQRSEIDRLDKYPKILGWLERVYYFSILTIFNLEIIKFFTIIGAWLTLKAAGNYYWMPKNQANKHGVIDDHRKRANFIVFLIGNLVSIGSVIIIFSLMKFLTDFPVYCHYWC